MTQLPFKFPEFAAYNSNNGQAGLESVAAGANPNVAYTMLAENRMRNMADRAEYQRGIEGFNQMVADSAKGGNEAALLSELIKNAKGVSESNLLPDFTPQSIQSMGLRGDSSAMEDMINQVNVNRAGQQADAVAKIGSGIQAGAAGGMLPTINPDTSTAAGIDSYNPVTPTAVEVALNSPSLATTTTTNLPNGAKQVIKGGAVPPIAAPTTDQAVVTPPANPRMEAVKAQQTELQKRLTGNGLTTKVVLTPDGGISFTTADDQPIAKVDANGQSSVQNAAEFAKIRPLITKSK